MFTDALILAIPTACVAWTISETEVFRDAREALARWAQARNVGDCRGWRKWIRCKLSYLPTCYYCTAHWVGLLFFACHPFALLSDGLRGAIIGYFTQIGLAVVYLSAFHVLRVQIRKSQAEANLTEKRQGLASRSDFQLRNRGFNGARSDGGRRDGLRSSATLSDRLRFSGKRSWIG